MRKALSVSCTLLLLLCVFGTVLYAGSVRKVYREEPVVGDEPWLQALRGAWDGDLIPSPPRAFQIGTVVDSTIMDHQSNGTIAQRIAMVGDSALHATAMVSPDPLFTERGMRYYYYYNGSFTKTTGYTEGSGVGNERGGYGSVLGYYWPDRGIGDVAVVATHTNLAGRDFGLHWYVFQDIFEGLAAFGPYEAPPGSGTEICDAFLWPSFYVSNDAVGHIAMIGFTFDAVCTNGDDDIKATYKTFDDSEWSEPVLLDETGDPGNWGPSGPDIPLMGGSDAGIYAAVTPSFGANVYYWESTDFGQTWGLRQSLTGNPLEPVPVPADTTSTEYRPLQNASIAVSPNGTPHVIWTEYQAEDNTGDGLYTIGEDPLFQYRTKMQHWDPINGITTVYRHPDGLANFAGGTAFSYNVGHPAIGFGPNDSIVYAVYEGFVDTDQDPTNQLYFGDIYVSVSTDGGATWKDRVNITNSPGSDDLYPSIARLNQQGVVQELPGFSVGTPDGINDFVLIYQNDDVAGTFLRADEPEANWDMMLIAPVDFDTIQTTGIEDDKPESGGLPRAFALAQNYPNPFNPQTTIRYTLAADTDVRLTIHNLRGEVVATLVSGIEKAGERAVTWNGRNAKGATVSSGIYFYRLALGDGKTMTKKMVLLK